MSLRKFEINQFLAYLMVARFSCIALANIPLFNMSLIFVYGMLFIISFILNYRYLERKETYALFAILIYIVFVVVKTTPVFGTIFNTQAFNGYILFFLFFIYLYMKRIETIKVLKICRVALIGFNFTYLYSIVMLIQDPTLSRRAAATIITENSVDTLNAVGGFDTVYGTVILFCFFLYLYQRAYNKKDLWLIRIGFFSGTVFLILASYGTAIVLFAFIIILTLMKKNKTMGACVTLLCSIFYALRKQLGTILYNFANTIGISYILKEKMQDIAIIMITGQSAGTLSGDDGRFARIRWDIDAFIKYPIFGGLGKNDIKIGAHSEVFDTLGRFGFIGFTLLLMFFYLFFKDNSQLVNDKSGKKCLSVSIVVYLIIAFLDPALYTQQILPLFILIPFFDLFVRGDSSYAEDTGVSSL
ncbi:MAG: hypothetical protein ACI32B_08265 [Erysipelotrichaceae bacterium]